MNETYPSFGKPHFSARDIAGHMMASIAASVALALTIALLSAFLGSDSSQRNLLGVASLTLILGLTWLGAIVVVLEARAHSEFKVGTTGFVPQVRPLIHVLRRKKWIPYRDVAICTVFGSTGELSCEIRLLDGTVMYMSESQGVPAEGIRKLADLLGSSLPEQRAMHRDLATRPEQFPIVMDGEAFSADLRRNLARAVIGIVVTAMALVVLGSLFWTSYGWPLAPAAVFVFVWFSMFLAAQNVGRVLLGRQFRMERTGFLPRYVSLRQALARKEFVTWEEIGSCILKRFRGMWIARVVLRGTGTIELRESEGVPREAIAEIAHRVPATIADLDAKREFP